MMTIWYVSKYASPPGSQGGMRGISLAKEFCKAGHQAILITSRANHLASFRTSEWKALGVGFKISQVGNVAMVCHQTLKYRRTSSLLRVLSWIHFELGLLRIPVRNIAPPSHIICSSLSLLTILNCYRLSKKHNAKLIFEIRDIWPLTLQTEWGLSNRHIIVKLLRCIERFGYQKSNLIVGTMPNLIEHVGGITESHAKVVCVPLGLDEDAIKSALSLDNRREHSGLFRVGYFGSVGRTNSLEFILRAAQEIGPEGGFQFDFWGTGDLLGQFAQKYSELPNVKFHGAVPRQKLFQEASNSDIFVLATEESKEFHYGQSLNKLLEYMLIGRPVIAAFSGYRSMLNEAGSGLYTPSGDIDSFVRALIRVRNFSDKKRENLGRKGRSWALNHRTYDQLARIYLDELLAL